MISYIGLTLPRIRDSPVESGIIIHEGYETTWIEIYVAVTTRQNSLTGRLVHQELGRSNREE